MKKQFTIIAIAMLVGMHAIAQIEISSPYILAKGSPVCQAQNDQAIGINPALLGLIKSKLSFSFLEFSGNLYSETLTSSQIMNNFFSSGPDFTLSEKTDAIDLFTNRKHFSSMSLNIISFSYSSPKLGGFAVSVRERLQGYLQLNSFYSNLIFNAYGMDYFDIKNTDDQGMLTDIESSSPELVSELGQGAGTQFSWIREYNFSYGRNIIESEDVELFAGFGIKYLSGLGYLNYYFDEGSQDLITHSALSPFFDCSFGDPTLCPVNNSNMRPPVGHGFAFDMGFYARINKKLSIGASISDLGTIKWDANVFVGSDRLFNTFKGNYLQSYHLIDEELSIPEYMGVEWENQESLSTPTCANIRIGATYEASTKLELGAEYYLPFYKNSPGSPGYSIISFGGGYQILPFIKIQTGINYMKYASVSIPIALIFEVPVSEKGTWELGLGHPDIGAMLSRNRHHVGLSFSFIRFNIE